MNSFSQFKKIDKEGNSITYECKVPLTFKELYYFIGGYIAELEFLGVPKSDICVKVSPIIDQYIIHLAYIGNNIYGPVATNVITMFGVKFENDHFENEIVIYSKSHACYDERFVKKINLNFNKK